MLKQFKLTQKLDIQVGKGVGEGKVSIIFEHEAS